MDDFPWTTETYWITIAFTVLPMGCYLLILPGLCKNKRMTLLVMLTLMLFVSQVLFILFVVFGAIAYNSENLNDTHRNKVFNALEFTFLGSFNVLYCVAHWVFAMKYWVTSRLMQTS